MHHGGWAAHRMAAAGKSRVIGRMSSINRPLEPVLVIGAGLGGLTLAHGLHNAQIPFKVYERDFRSTSRSQGYGVRINNMGLDALKACLSPEVYTRLKHTAGRNDERGTIAAGVFSCTDARTGLKIPSPRRPSPAPGNDPAAQPRPSPLNSIPVDRSVMRRVLLESLPEDSVVFDKAFQKYTSADRGVTAHFADGSTSDTGSLLVGVDGTRSRVSAQLIGPKAAPHDTLSRMVYGKTPLDHDLQSKIHADVRSGVSLVADLGNPGGQVRMFLEVMKFDHPEIQDYVYWVLTGDSASFKRTEARFAEMTPAEARILSLEVTEDWVPGIRCIFEAQAEKDTALLRMTTADPNGLPGWKTDRRVTVLGDAIHTMSPTGGSGANTALYDAGILLKALVGGREQAEAEGAWDEEVIKGYEDEMRKYGSGIVKLSYGSATKAFGVKPIKALEALESFV